VTIILHMRDTFVGHNALRTELSSLTYRRPIINTKKCRCRHYLYTSHNLDRLCIKFDLKLHRIYYTTYLNYTNLCTRLTKAIFILLRQSFFRWCSSQFLVNHSNYYLPIIFFKASVNATYSYTF
jgi:hypothetical protein